MAERTLAGQDFGNGIVKVEFDMLAPGMTETSITADLFACYDNLTPGKSRWTTIAATIDEPILSAKAERRLLRK
jgi:hypothetical protein